MHSKVFLEEVSSLIADFIEERHDGPKGEFHAPVELVCDAMNMARKHGAEKTNAEILKMMDPLGTWSTKAAICDLDGCYLMRHGATSGQVKEGK